MRRCAGADGSAWSSPCPPPPPLQRQTPPAGPGASRWLPFGDDSRARRLVKVAAWLVGIALAVGALELLGVDVRGWFSDLWDALSGVGLGYLLAGWALQTVQTTMTALGWFSILRAAFPAAPVALSAGARRLRGRRRDERVPAREHRHARDAADVRRDHPRGQLPGVLGGMVVQKIFFTVAGTFVYVYLFAVGAGIVRAAALRPARPSRPGARDRRRRGLLLVVLGRIFWRKLKGLWEKAMQGGAILASRREYAVRVVLPSFVAWLAKLGVIAVFLAAYGITVTFHTIMSVMGGNSIANTVSVTPGGVGVNQATNVAALNDVTDAATATAYSLGQQLAVTAWNIGFAVAVVIWAFGWTGGKILVEQSYADAKVKVEQQRAARAETKAAKRAEHGGSARVAVAAARRTPRPVRRTLPRPARRGSG